MKKISLLIAAFIMSMSMVMAQPPQHGERKPVDPKERAEKRTEHMAKEYGLNDAQKEKLLALNIAVTEKMGDKRAGKKHRADKADREKRMTAMKESRQEYDAQIKEILTNEQFDKYQARQAERQAKAKERTKDGHKNRHSKKERA